MRAPPASQDEDLKKWLTDVGSVLEFLTGKIKGLELERENINHVRTPLTELAMKCGVSQLADSRVAAPVPATAFTEVQPFQASLSRNSNSSQVTFGNVIDVVEEDTEVHPFAIVSETEEEPLPPAPLPVKVAAPKKKKKSRPSAGMKDDSGVVTLGLQEDADRWEPIAHVCIAKHSLRGTAQWYWIGLLKNLELRAIHMQLRAKVTTILSNANALNEDLMEDEEKQLEEEAQALRKAGKSEDWISRQTSLLRSGSMHSQYSAYEDNATEIIQSMRCLQTLEELIKRQWVIHGLLRKYFVTTDELMQWASCPFDEFAEQYISDRDVAMQIHDPAERRVELCKATLKGVARFELLCHILNERINANDSLLFKVLVLCLQVLTTFGQYVWSHESNPLAQAMGRDRG